MPNKILLTGQSGIGKSTFAYHFINAILSDKEEKWMTCKEFYFECDNQRERYSKDSKILKQLDELNDHVMLIEKKYQNV